MATGAPMSVPPVGQPVVASAAVARGAGPQREKLMVPVAPPVIVAVSVASTPAVVLPVGFEVVASTGRMRISAPLIWLSCDPVLAPSRFLS